MKDTDSAFLVLDSYVMEGGQWRLDCLSRGMTLPQYAAIKLRVPRSGDPDIDAMIRESRRADFAGQIMAGTVDWMDSSVDKNSAKYAFSAADAMLAEWEKEASGEKGN